MTTSTSIIREDAEQIVDDLSGPMTALKGTTLLVTGASGFLCSHFLETIAAFNESARPVCRVLAVDNFRTGLPERLSWIQGRPDMELRQCDASQPGAAQGMPAPANCGGRKQKQHGAGERRTGQHVRQPPHRGVYERQRDGAQGEPAGGGQDQPGMWCVVSGDA